MLKLRRKWLSAERNTTFIGWEQARYHPSKRTLSAARLPNNCYRLSTRHLHGDLLQNRLIGAWISGTYALCIQHHLITGAVLLVLAKGTHGKQAAGIFLFRVFQKSASVALFNQIAVAQHHNAVRQLGHHGKIMRDVDRRDTARTDRFFDRREHLDLRGHIERRSGLIKNNEPGIATHRHSRHCPLQLAARDLVREPITDVLRVRQIQLAV